MQRFRDSAPHAKKRKTAVKPKRSFRGKGLIAGLVVAGAGAAILWMNKYAPFWKANVCSMSGSGSVSCSGDPDPNLRSKLGEFYHLLNRKDPKVLELATDDYFILNSGNPDTPLGVVLGQYDPETGNTTLYSGADLSIFAHEFLHKFFEEGFDADEKAELKGKLLRLYEVSAMSDAEQNQLLGDDLTPELKAYLDGIYTIDTGLALERAFETEEDYREMLASEIFADMPFITGLKVPPALLRYYENIFNGELIEQIRGDTNINVIFQE